MPMSFYAIVVFQILWVMFPVVVTCWALRLSWLLHLRDQQIALLKSVMRDDDKLALSSAVSSNELAGLRAQSIPPMSASTSGPHEATYSQKSANGKTPPYSID